MRSMPLTAVTVLGVAALTVSACTGFDAMPAPTPTPTPEVTVEASGDGVLRIGTLFPTSGDTAVIAPALVAATEVAVRDVNASGGVLGEPVELFHRDSGDAADEQLEVAMAELIERGVDVVIGPTSSVLAESIIPLASAAGITVISPAATDPALTAADPEGVFFRTIPSLENQGRVIADSVRSAGGSAIALVTDDVERGLALQASVQAELGVPEEEVETDEAADTDTATDTDTDTDTDTAAGVVAVEQLTTSSNAARLAAELAAVEPDAVVIATTTALDEKTRELVVALADEGISGRTIWFTSLNAADYSATLPEGVLEGAYGVREGAAPSDQFTARVRQSDPAVATYRYAVEAYDAVVLAALAATESGDDGGPSIAARLPRVTAEGFRCGSYGECVTVFGDLGSFHYAGLSGSFDFDAAGNVTSADYGLYRYSAENRPERIGTLRLR